MKIRLLICGFAAGLAAALAVGACLPQEADDELPTEEEMHQLWMKFGTPGKHHVRLEAQAGEWDVTMRTWWKGPDAEPDVNTAVVRSEVIFGGRFLKSEMEGTIKFEFEGQMTELPIKGLGITGYDSFKKKYFTTWIDSHNTGIWMAEGTADPSGTVFTYFGTSDDWMTGEHDKPVKWIDRQLDHDTWVSEMHDLTLDAGRSKVFEMHMTRRSPQTKR